LAGQPAIRRRGAAQADRKRLLTGEESRRRHPICKGVPNVLLTQLAPPESGKAAARSGGGWLRPQLRTLRLARVVVAEHRATLVAGRLALYAARDGGGVLMGRPRRRCRRRSRPRLVVAFDWERATVAPTAADRQAYAGAACLQYLEAAGAPARRRRFI